MLTSLDCFPVGPCASKYDASTTYIRIISTLLETKTLEPHLRPIESEPIEIKCKIVHAYQAARRSLGKLKVESQCWGKVEPLGGLAKSVMIRFEFQKMIKNQITNSYWPKGVHQTVLNTLCAWTHLTALVSLWKVVVCRLQVPKWKATISVYQFQMIWKTSEGDKSEQALFALDFFLRISEHLPSIENCMWLPQPYTHMNPQIIFSEFLAMQ